MSVMGPRGKRAIGGKESGGDPLRQFLVCDIRPHEHKDKTLTAPRYYRVRGTSLTHRGATHPPVLYSLEMYTESNRHFPDRRPIRPRLTAE